MTPESVIKWEGRQFFAVQVSRIRYEVRRNLPQGYAELYGWGADLAQVVRTAQRLDRYPPKA